MNNNHETPNNTGQLLKLYEILLDQMHEGVHVVDENGVSIIYNQKMSEIESMDKNRVLQKNIIDVFTFPEHENSTLLQALRNGASTKKCKTNLL